MDWCKNRIHWLDLAVVRTPHNLTEPLVQRTDYSILKVPDNLKHESVEFDLPRPVFPFSPFRQKGGKRERERRGRDIGRDRETEKARDRKRGGVKERKLEI